MVPISDDPERFEPGARLLHGDGRTVIVTGSHRHGDRFLVRFEGVESRDAAEGLRGPVYVTADELRDLDDDEFWEHDLVGCEVALADGRVVGTVTDVVPGAAHDLLAVETERGERYIPLVKAIVIATDVAAKRVLIDPPEGLLD